MQFLLIIGWFCCFLFCLWISILCIVETCGGLKEGLFDKSFRYKCLGVFYWVLITITWDFCLSFITIDIGSSFVAIKLGVVIDMQNDIERLHAINSHAPACALPSNTTDDLAESKEEREAFELLERRQQDPQLIDNRQAKINAMASIARQCPTTSIEGICALLVDAGYEKTDA